MNDMALNRDVQNEAATATARKAEQAAPKAVPYASPSTATAPKLQRLVSLDAFRGLAMVLMVSAGLATTTVFKELSKDPAFAKSGHYGYWQHWNYHTDHTSWTGCSLWDLIQPCFMFMVGAAVPFSIASRQAKGQGFGRMLVHAVWRALILTLLGVYFATNVRGTTQTAWEFTNVLAQIGLGYVFLFLLAWLKPRWQLVAAFTILIGYWLAFAVYRAPAAGFDYGLVYANDVQHPTGFAAHWDKNTNLGAAFDRWFLNQFPQQPANWPIVGWVPGLSESVHYWFPNRLFIANKGGYVTLNFVPSLVTMTFGLLAGGLLRRTSLAAGWKILTLATAGAAGLGLGMLLDYTGICPSAKRIWTPSWTLLSAGWAFLGLAFFYLVCDVIRFRVWALPLVVVGMNSIVVYVLSMSMKPWFRDAVGRHFGPDAFKNGARSVFGSVQFEKMFEMSLFLLLLWLIAAWMYRRRIFIKV